MLQSSPLQSPPRAWYMIGALIAFVVAGGFSVFFELQQSSLSTQLAALKAQQEALSSPALQAAASATDAADAAVIVKSKLKAIQQQQLLWSKIVEKIENTIPKLKDSNDPIVNFRSYSGSEEGKISVSATTRSGSPDPFTDVALTIRAFAGDPGFKDVFAPSITKTLTPAGETILSFSINFEYIKQIF